MKRSLLKLFDKIEKNRDAFPIKLGIDYPFPIVDHKEQRDIALSMYKACK